jgi:hypothetical protein
MTPTGLLIFAMEASIVLALGITAEPQDAIYLFRQSLGPLGSVLWFSALDAPNECVHSDRKVSRPG